MNFLTRFFKMLTNRLLIILVVFVVLFYILVARLYELQIVNGEKIKEEFEQSVIREVSSDGQRGNIYDRYGFPLSENILAYDVYLNDSYEVEDIDEMIYKLSTIMRKNGDELLYVIPIKYEKDKFIFTEEDKDVNEFKRIIFGRDFVTDLTKEEIQMDAKDVYYYLRDDLFKVDKLKYSLSDILQIINLKYSRFTRRYKKYKPEKIAINVSKKTIAAIEENRISFPGITIEESYYRQYNDAEYFSHIVGYTREISEEKLKEMQNLGYEPDDIIGFVGIEKEFEEYLRAYDGYERVEANSLGKTMKLINKTTPVDGRDVILTIDHDLQIETYHILEQNLADILAENLYYSVPYRRTSYVLLKDVFDSVIRYELIDIGETALLESESGKLLHDKSIETIERLKENVTNQIKENSSNTYLRTNESMYFFILNTMVSEGRLNENFYKSPFYSLFTDEKISFYQLMQSCYDRGDLAISLENSEVIYQHTDSVEKKEDIKNTSFEVDETLIRKIDSIVFDNILLSDELLKYYYLETIKNDKIYYKNLCLLIIDLGMVTATENEYNRLKSGSASPLYFIKEKITSLEIKPKDLALDPCTGSVVIADVDTGEVLALVSYPTYDNNRFVNKFDGQYYNELRADPTKPLYPRATMSKTVPGSTFKMATGLAALEEGVIAPSESVLAKGIFEKILPPPRCWIYGYGGSHGYISIRHALEQSCNYFFYEMAFRMGKNDKGEYSSERGVERLNYYLDLIGLGSKTGVEVVEAEPDLPELDPVRGAIGQENNNYTPVGLARYMNSIADNGRVKELNLVDKVVDKNKNVVVEFTPEVLNEKAFKQENIDVIKEGMLLVTRGSRGTARGSFRNFPMAVAGKTGTAQITSFDEKSNDPVKKIKFRPDHSVFACFAPYENPEISVSCVLQFAHGSNSGYATDCTIDVLANYFKMNEKVDDLTFEEEFW